MSFAVIMKYILIAVVAYLLGSFSAGLAVAKIKKGPNLREVGSGNTGATNVTRTMGLSNGLITFFGDVLKAVLSCLLGLWLCGRNGALVGGLFAVIGHNWPLYYGFKGGKGAASTCGVLLVCDPIGALICYLVAILIIALLRYISVGSMVLVAVNLIVVCFRFPDPVSIVWAILLLVLLVWRHKENIKRLIQGNERKFTGKKEK